MTDLECERALLAGGKEEGNIGSQVKKEHSHWSRHCPLIGWTRLSVRSVTGLLLPGVLLLLLILYVQLEDLQSGHAVTTILPRQPPGGGEGAAVSWLRNMHGEYSLAAPEGHNFSEAAGLCQSLHAHLPFIDNQDEERELVVGDIRSHISL